MADFEAAIAAYIRRFANPPADQLAAFIGAGKRRKLAAGEDFCALGQEKHEAAFIHDGVVRYYVLLADGEDSTKDFSFANSFTVSFGSAVSGRPAAVAIAAVTDCILTVWPYSRFLALYDQNEEWQRFGRRIAEMLYVRKEKREMSFLLQNAAERYRVMRETFPAQLESVPQRLIASYLGVRPQSLSRIKRRADRLT